MLEHFQKVQPWLAQSLLSTYVGHTQGGPQPSERLHYLRPYLSLCEPGQGLIWAHGLQKQKSNFNFFYATVGHGV